MEMTLTAMFQVDKHGDDPYSNVNMADPLRYITRQDVLKRKRLQSTDQYIHVPETNQM